jgi:hypothetical protein
MPARRTRRTVCIEHPDGEPLTRADIQFDLLSHIFADDTKAFSDPHNGPSKLSFRDLYVNAILHSPKTKSVLKEKLALPTFATDFAMLALLTNVGRIAATMSCMSAETCFLHLALTYEPKFLQTCEPLNGLITPYQPCSARMGTSSTPPE